MHFQIISDIHLGTVEDIDAFTVTPKAPYLALLGDIGPLTWHDPIFFHKMLELIHRLAQDFQLILYVPGNQEVYRSSWSEMCAVMKEVGPNMHRVRPGGGQFVFMDRMQLTFKAPESLVTIFGCSLFSHIPSEHAKQVEETLEEFRESGDDWDVKAHNEAHARDVEWLNSTVAAAEESPDVSKIVILTHWSPSTDARATDPAHAGSALAGAFATDLSGEEIWQSKKLAFWGFGHTHHNCDFTVERDGGKQPVRLYTNQKSHYSDKARKFDAEAVVEF